ncbi:hypothetical protein CHS0354_007871 [Potamilus streckersoni]|uniref:C-type lectin domain-containing protein n=1 Tax=Potamilus streckersoni TaxID=2493646 RepID=A0AAE0SYX5_9BIVA|nr:hypothetical protein CHS0354_007871 [Potamilus streckersoni]
MDGLRREGSVTYLYLCPRRGQMPRILCDTTYFNASMVQLETTEEKQHVVNHLQATYEKIVPMSFFWVGAMGADSAWLWISGIPLIYVDFAEGIKTAPGCLAFGVPSLEKYQGMACTQQNLVLCERGAPTVNNAGQASGSTSGTTGSIPIVG